MGLDENLSKLCVDKLGNNLGQIIDFINNNKGRSFSDLKCQLNSILPEGSIKKFEKKMEAQMIIDQVVSELPEDDEAYLDFNAEDDLLFIKKYYSLLDS